ncbi:hypothetical protein N6N64_23325, partial [Escherichia albertii]|nr:hypothetical protein [Escherichia albertii]
ILLRQKQKKLIMLPSETMIWQPEFTDKTLSRKPGAVHTASELRWIYRNKDNDQILKNIKFYLHGKEIPAEKILGAPEWKDYNPKYSGATYKYS